MTIDQDEIKIILGLADELITAAQLSLFSSKHSKKTFTQYQLFKLMVVKTFMTTDYR